MVLFRKHWQDWCKHFSASGIAMEQEQWLSVADFFIINLSSFIMKAAHTHTSNNKFRFDCLLHNTALYHHCGKTETEKSSYASPQSFLGASFFKERRTTKIILLLSQTATGKGTLS